MEIEAKVSLYYDEGQSYSPEGLVMIVKFKDPNKLFKKRIKKYLHKSSQIINLWNEKGIYKDYNDYLTHVENTINDQYLLKVEAANMVQKYFKEEYKSSTNESRRKLINGKLKELNNLTVKVTIK